MTAERAQELVREWLAANPERLACLRDSPDAERQWLAYAIKQSSLSATPTQAIAQAAAEAEAGTWRKEVFYNFLPTAAGRPGRPAGLTKASGAKVSTGLLSRRLQVRFLSGAPLKSMTY